LDNMHGALPLEQKHHAENGNNTKKVLLNYPPSTALQKSATNAKIRLFIPTPGLACVNSAGWFKLVVFGFDRAILNCKF